MCYERGWEARQRNEEATGQIRRLFARYRAEAERTHREVPARPARPVQPVVVREHDERKPVLH